MYIYIVDRGYKPTFDLGGTTLQMYMHTLSPVVTLILELLTWKVLD